jgi:tetratricopeptide (TPR) repeat protein
VLAKIHLLADRRQEALQELEAFDLMKSQPIQRTKLSPKEGLVSEMIRKLIGPKSDNLHLQVQNTLAENIQGLLTKKADELLFEEEFEEALPLEREAEALRADTPRTALWTHLSLAESYLKKGLLSEAANEYGESLPLCPTPRYESYVLRKIISTQDLPFGYVIWKKEGLCYLRWWSKSTKTFTGTVESSRSFRSIGEANLKLNVDYRYSRKKIVFRGVAERDAVQGLTLGVRSPSRLTFSLEIRGQGEVQDHVTLLPEATHPRAMPFVLECPK